ncbi:MAG: hypothetical protein M0R33_11695 [Methylomonas sp.]|jgi:hypothetical protein|uniref:hypothetical protein n=1 Tax=Methylomonas sp. TaxID=418 RepID=UPI0025D1B861|nr:hypothetical protein [Methylomonas sp.]MCK9607098.1 hypothetical protein [Methylomonas sp.]
MKAIDFFYLSSRLLRPIMVGFLLCYALPAIAEPPSAEDFNRSSKLVLTLSDKWLDPNAQNSLRKSNRQSISKSPAENTKAKDVPIGCGMDVTPLTNSDASLGDRLVGKCNLTLHY